MFYPATANTELANPEPSLWEKHEVGPWERLVTTFSSANQHQTLFVFLPKGLLLNVWISDGS